MWNKVSLSLIIIFLGIILYNTFNVEAEVPTKEINTKSLYNENDILCLKQNIHYEASGESFIGKLAVATITLNRKNLSNKTICDVVFEKDQFSWTNNVKVPIVKFNDDINFATKLILNHNIKIDILEDAIYYHSINVNPLWSKYKRKVMVVGNHVFYTEK